SRSGSFFNATTRSGTNSPHGSLYEFLRNEKLDARNFFGVSRDLLKRNHFGAALGGPVLLPRVYNGKSRTFFFVSYGGMPERQGNVITRISPPAAMLTGDFSGVSNTIYDPQTTAANATRAPFPGNRIPSSRVSPQAAFFNPYLTTAAVPGGLFTFSP